MPKRPRGPLTKTGPTLVAEGDTKTLTQHVQHIAARVDEIMAILQPPSTSLPPLPPEPPSSAQKRRLPPWPATGSVEPPVRAKKGAATRAPADPNARPPQDNLAKTLARAPSNAAFEDADSLRLHNARDLIEFNAWVELAGNANTKKAYSWGQKLWLSFCKDTKRPHVPADGYAVALCMKTLLERGYARGTICNIVLGAVHGLHLKAGLASPTKSDPVRLAKRLVIANTPAPIPKKPLSKDILIKMVEVSNSSFEDARDLCIIVLAIAACLRPWNLSALLPDDGDLCLLDGHECVSLFIEKAKNDQGRQGHHLLLGKALDFKVCPVVHIKRYLSMRSHNAQYFFHSIRDPRKPVPTGTIRNRLKRLLARAGLPQEEIRFYSGYSMRRMAASAAAQAGVSDRLIRRHGGWSRNSTAVDLYVDEALDQAVTVSQTIMNAETKELVFRGSTKPRTAPGPR
jgi:integrase